MHLGWAMLEATGDACSCQQVSRWLAQPHGLGAVHELGDHVWLSL